MSSPSASNRSSSNRPGEVRRGRPAKDRAALLSNLFPVTPGARPSSSLKLVTRDRLHTLPQMRSNPSQAKITEMRESIAENRKRNLGIEDTGILQALLVTPYEDYKNEKGQSESGHYLIITGERRYLGSEGVTDELPCVVVNTNHLATNIMQLSENIQREDPPVGDVARQLGVIQQETGASVRDLAAMVGKSRSWVQEYLTILKAGDDVQALIKQTDLKGSGLKSALLIDKAKDQTLRGRLLEAASKGAGLKNLEHIVNAHELRQASQGQTVDGQPVARTNEQSSAHGSADGSADGHDGADEQGGPDSFETEAPVEREADRVAEVAFGQNAQSMAASFSSAHPSAHSQVISGLLPPMPQESSASMLPPSKRIDTIDQFLQPASILVAEAARAHEANIHRPTVPEALAQALDAIEVEIERLRQAERARQLQPAPDSAAVSGDAKNTMH